VCSLAGLFTGVSAIVGVVFGHLGRAAAKRGEADNGNLGLAGLIVGYVIIGLGLAITIFYVVFFLALFASAGECDATDPNSWCYPTYD
jgi:hypothetical protein